MTTFAPVKQPRVLGHRNRSPYRQSRPCPADARQAHTRSDGPIFSRNPPQRPACYLHGQMQLVALRPPRERLRATFLDVPAKCRCIRTMVESIKMYSTSASPPIASATHCQIPLHRQRAAHVHGVLSTDFRRSGTSRAAAAAYRQYHFEEPAIFHRRSAMIVFLIRQDRFNSPPYVAPPQDSNHPGALTQKTEGKHISENINRCWQLRANSLFTFAALEPFARNGKTSLSFPHCHAWMIQASEHLPDLAAAAANTPPGAARGARHGNAIAIRYRGDRLPRSNGAHPSTRAARAATHAVLAATPSVPGFLLIIAPGGHWPL